MMFQCIETLPPPTFADFTGQVINSFTSRNVVPSEADATKSVYLLLLPNIPWQAWFFESSLGNW